jgi:hypothetical protein
VVLAPWRVLSYLCVKTPCTLGVGLTLVDPEPLDPEPLDPEPLLPEPELLPLLEAVVEELVPDEPDPHAQSISTTEASTQTMMILFMFIFSINSLLRK